MKNIKAYQEYLLPITESHDTYEAVMMARALAASGNERQLTKILDTKIDPKFMDSVLVELFSTAVDHAKTGVCRLLLARGAKPRIDDLKVAMMGPAKNVLGALLLEHMPDLGSYKNQFLGLAAAIDSPVLAKILIKMGASIDSYTSIDLESKRIRGHGLRIPDQESTALTMAAANASHRTAALLLKMGSDPNEAILNSKTPTQFAVIELKAKFRTFKDHPSSSYTKKGVDDARKTLILLIRAGGDPLKGSTPQEILEIFDGDVSMFPEGDLKAKLIRMQRGKRAFGM